MSLNIKKGDNVKIIAGNDKGKFGQVVAVDRANGRVTVEGKGLSVVKKAVRARKATEKGGIVELPKSTDISNVMAVCAACGKATRIRHGVADGKKVRICAKCGAVLETKAVKEEKKAKVAVRRKKKTTETAAAETVQKTEQPAVAAEPDATDAK
jgi:large subunit ribosomal protein L24